MFCTACGSQIPDDSRFCGNCGAPAEKGSASGADQSSTPPAEGGTPTQSRAQYVPPGAPPPPGEAPPTGAPPPPPPPKPDRTATWIALSAVVVILAAAAIAIPLLARAGKSDETTSTTESVAATTTTTVAPTTTASTSGPTSTSPPTTASATTTTTTAPSDEWVEVDIPGGPWEAYDVAVSDDALLLSTSTPTGSRLVAVMLESGDIIELAEADAQYGIDIYEDVAVWWEGNTWDDVAQRWTDQHIYAFRLPDGPLSEIAAGGTASLGMPQVALPWVSWVESTPWPADPELVAHRIMLARVNDNGAPAGAATALVPLALANIMGDSSWHYSLSRTVVGWETHLPADGYDRGTHVLEIDTASHGHIGEDAWRPSLWQHTLVYWEDGLWFTDLSAGGISDLDAQGYLGTAGPGFAAYYRVTGAGVEIVAQAYDGSHEQVLGVTTDPPWFLAPISVSPGHAAFVVGNEVHLFRWS